KWWKEAIIYQVYPRSFKDSNGDGIGDLRGILCELSYIVSLGVNAVWINPVYRSPGRDNNYDISDFRDVDPVYGTMVELDELIRACHSRGIRIIMDMVINHTSDQHEWFVQARTSRDNPYYSFYIWWPAEKGKPPYRRGFFDTAGEAWTYNEATDSYFLHYFSPEQPDLNWENAEVRRRIFEMLRFWLDKGVDGLRFDALTFISKDMSLPEITDDVLHAEYGGDWGNYYASGPRLHDYLREMNDKVLRHYDCVAIAEASGVFSDHVLEFVAEDRGELDLLYHFEGMVLGAVKGAFKKPDAGGYSREAFKEVYTRWSDVFREKGWGTIYLGNHDQPRMVSRWGNDSEAFRVFSAKLLFTFLLTMRGTPFLYYGDELGMTNIRFSSIDEYEDIETRQMYEKIVAEGGDVEAFLRDQQLMARDNGRTPMQWTSGKHAGFTSGRPWLAIHPNYVRVNREAEEKDADSVLNFVRRMIRIRKAYPALVYGDYLWLSHDGSPVYAYNRVLGGMTLSVLLNFSDSEQGFDGLLSPPSAGDVLINNYPVVQWTRGGLRLKPWQAFVFACGR
ncbi:MAG TPA: alpha-glucosidase, partial [Puia sp.]|nr:alpha-glucosidase [Puia sp.]